MADPELALSGGEIVIFDDRLAHGQEPVDDDCCAMNPAAPVTK